MAFPCPTCRKPSIGVSLVYDGRQSRQCKGGHFFGISGYVPEDPKKIFGGCKADPAPGMMIQRSTRGHRGSHNTEEETEKTMQTTNENGGNVKQLSAIERALAAAKARKAARAAAHGEDSGTLTSDDAPKAKAPKTPKAKPSDEERNAAKAQRDADRAARKEAKTAKDAAHAEAKAARKAEREAKKAAKAADKAERTAGKKSAHMKKVDKARAKCPALLEEAAALFASAGSLPIGQMMALSAHLAVQARALQTARAATATPLPMGATVRITDGEPRFVGLTGTVTESNRLRAKVTVEGMKKYVYIYTGEAEVVTAK